MAGVLQRHSDFRLTDLPPRGRIRGVAAPRPGGHANIGGTSQMSTTLFRRPPRRLPPEMPMGELSLQEPPVMPEEPTGNLSLLLTFLPMALGSSMMILLFVRPGAGGATTWIAGGLMMVTTMSMMVGQMGRTTSSRKRRTKGERRDYLRYLPQPRRKVRRQAAQQRSALASIHPDPGPLWSVAMSARLGERRPAHHHFA